MATNEIFGRRFHRPKMDFESKFEIQGRDFVSSTFFVSLDSGVSQPSEPMPKGQR